MSSFQNFVDYNLGGVCRAFFTAWIIFGIPIVVLAFGMSFFQLRIIRSASLGRLIFGLSCAGLIFGAVTGYVEVWTDHHYIARDAEPGKLLEASSFVGAPGDFIANSYGGDWQGDEAWDYRLDITLWNAVFWMSIFQVTAFVIRADPKRWFKIISGMRPSVATVPETNV